MNKSGKVKRVFYDAATSNYDDVFLFNGDGTAAKASGPGDWAGVSDIRVKDQISDFTDGLDLFDGIFGVSRRSFACPAVEYDILNRREMILKIPLYCITLYIIKTQAVFLLFLAFCVKCIGLSDNFR